MSAHRLARGRRVAGSDGSADPPVLILELLRIARLRRAIALLDPHGLPRDDVVTEILQEFREPGVPGRSGNGTMKIEIGSDSRVAPRHHRIDPPEPHLH